MKTTKEQHNGKPKEGHKKLSIDDILEATSLVDELDEETLRCIGDEAIDGFLNDLASRKPWEDDLENWTKLALQISDKKTYPWPGAANIKFPLLSTAAMQFAARAYPSLIPSNGAVVKCQVIGSDPTGEKTQRAERISKHMSYQVMDEMENWEEDMDKLLLTLPIAGTCFKKTYWDSGKKINCSKLILPKYLIVNYSCRSLDEAERISEVIYLTKRQIKERINRGIFKDVELGDPSNSEVFDNNKINRFNQDTSTVDETTPYTLIEQHTYLDLDDDGYSEPYVVTVEEASREVLRIVPRFDEESVTVDEKQNVVAIETTQFYTKYSFIPNPDGGFYDIGFGRLLGPINDSANTIINQLVDAGSLSNLQAGFIGKGLRIKMAETRFQPGEWKAVNAIGDDLKKQIFPLPVREPSDVLFKLLDLLLKSGKELASVAEIFTGKMPGQNTPATTTMATVEQGMKVFTAVYKRVFRSLAQEFQKIYKLNQKYLNPQEYIEVLDMEVTQNDYQGPENDVIPAADPSAVSNQEKQARATAMMQILQLGTLDPMKVTMLYLEAHDIPDPQQFLKQPSPPPPDPKVEAEKMKAQIEMQKAQAGIEIEKQKLEITRATKEEEIMAKRRLAEVEIQGKQMQHILEGRMAAEQHQSAMIQQHQNHQMNMQHTDQKARLGNEIAKMQARNKAATPNKKGKDK